MMKCMNIIGTKLEELNRSDLYPFHMPGHKRNWDCNSKGNSTGDLISQSSSEEITLEKLSEEALCHISQIDITEIDDFDNLHDAQGFIRKAQERANRLYGAQETYFLVNGSSCGVLSAVSSVAQDGGVLIADRASHKSFYHAIYLKNANMRLIAPQYNRKYGFPYPMQPEDLQKVLEDESSINKIDAVFLTSPTYEGIPARIGEIVNIAHAHRIPVIVDEAHGAHFGLCNEPSVPDSAIHQGADLVIHSVHKTLPSLTQTALLHVQGNLIDRERLRRYLHIYQTSSPSYVFMTSIDSAMNEMEINGEQWFARLMGYRDQIQKGLKECKHLNVLPREVIPDPCKLVIASLDGSMSGQEIYEELRLHYHIQCEMAGESYALGILTGNDTEEGIHRLVQAIRDIDERINGSEIKGLKKTAGWKEDSDKVISHKAISDKDNLNEENPEKENPATINAPATKEIGFHKAKVGTYTLSKAWDMPREEVPLEEARERISADFVNFYPPGTPILLPGEAYGEEEIRQLHQAIREGRNLQGLRQEQDQYYVQVLIEKEEIV